MSSIPTYKSRVVQSLYNRKLSERDNALAEISVLLETPVQAAAEKLETQMSKLLHCNMHISQIDSMFGPEEEPIEETKD
jgi:hypothetical protein